MKKIGKICTKLFLIIIILSSLSKITSVVYAENTSDVIESIKKIDSLSGNQSTIESSTVVKEENITEQKESTDEEIGSQETDAKEKETINKEEISNVQYINSVTLPQLLGEENIKEFQEVGNGSLAIKGWALADVGMYAVEILIDGKVVDRASLGEERLDIYN